MESLETNLFCELDSNGLEYGMWSIDIDDINIPAIWKNSEGNREFDMSLKKLDKINKSIEYRTPEFCEYTTDFNNKKYGLNIYNGFDSNLNLILYDLQDNVDIMNTYSCKNNRCDSFDMIVKNKYNIDNVYFKVLDDDQLISEITFSDKKTSKPEFNKISVTEAFELSYLSKNYGIYISFPKLNIENFEFIENEIKDIFDQLLTDVEKMVDSKDNQDSDRLKYFITGTLNPE
ncbi:MAG: hypothetical protein R2771_10925 [Saprospiraceae bacterium]